MDQSKESVIIDSKSQLNIKQPTLSFLNNEAAIKRILDSFQLNLNSKKDVYFSYFNNPNSQAIVLRLMKDYINEWNKIQQEFKRLRNCEDYMDVRALRQRTKNLVNSIEATDVAGCGQMFVDFRYSMLQKISEVLCKIDTKYFEMLKKVFNRNKAALNTEQVREINQYIKAVSANDLAIEFAYIDYYIALIMHSLVANVSKTSTNYLPKLQSINIEYLPSTLASKQVIISPIVKVHPVPAEPVEVKIAIQDEEKVPETKSLLFSQVVQHKVQKTHSDPTEEIRTMSKVLQGSLVTKSIVSQLSKQQPSTSKSPFNAKASKSKKFKPHYGPEIDYSYYTVGDLNKVLASLQQEKERNEVEKSKLTIELQTLVAHNEGKKKQDTLREKIRRIEKFIGYLKRSQREVLVEIEKRNYSKKSKAKAKQSKTVTTVKTVVTVSTTPITEPKPEAKDDHKSSEPSSSGYTGSSENASDSMPDWFEHVSEEDIKETSKSVKVPTSIRILFGKDSTEPPKVKTESVKAVKSISKSSHITGLTGSKKHNPAMFNQAFK